MTVNRLGKVVATGCLALAAVVLAPACDRKEKVLDIETPDGEVEVERDQDSGDVDVDVDRDREQP